MGKSDDNASGDFVAPHKVYRNQFGTWDCWKHGAPPDRYSGPLPRIAGAKRGESLMRRAFRRFPIDRHKPGGW